MVVKKLWDWFINDWSKWIAIPDAAWMVRNMRLDSDSPKTQDKTKQT